MDFFAEKIRTTRRENNTVDKCSEGVTSKFSLSVI